MSTRAEAIATELQYHHTQPGATCTCGHVFRPGDWISYHRAEFVDIAIALNAMGVDLDAQHAAVLAALKVVPHEPQ